MKVYFSKKAELGLEKVYEHIVHNFNKEQAQTIRNELVSAILKLGEFPELGLKIAAQADKRVLYIQGNAIIYEIVLQKEPFVVIRNIRPRKNK